MVDANHDASAHRRRTGGSHTAAAILTSPREGGDLVTLIRCARGFVLAKTIKRNPDGTITRLGYDKASHFACAQVPLASIFELHTLLVHEVEPDPRIAFIRGKPIDVEGRDLEQDLIEYRLRRSTHQVDSPPTYRAAGHRVTMFDIEGGRLPNGFDPRHEPAACVRHVVECLLPAEFRNVTCHYQLSSRTGFAPDFGVHLWFWLDHPWSDEHCKAFSDYVNARSATDARIDRSVFNPVQIHYTSRPIFEEGILDPIPRRSGLILGTRHSVDNSKEYTVAADCQSTWLTRIRGKHAHASRSKRQGVAPRGYNERVATLHNAANKHIREHVRGACCAFFLANANGDADWLLRDLRIHVDAAKKLQGRASYEYQDSELIALIESAQRFAEAKRGEK